MRKITAITYVSLDGVMQGVGDADEDSSGGFTYGGWIMPFWDEMMNEVISKLMDGPFDLLLGRTTYDIFQRYWPQNLDNPIGQKFAKATKYVMTRAETPLDWTPCERLKGDAAQTVKSLKSGAGPELHIWGSGNALQSLIAAELVDEFMLWSFPLILGDGKRLLLPGLPALKLNLVDSQRSTTGVVINTYRPVSRLNPKT